MTKTQILIVEDDLDLSEMLTAYFRVQNYDVLAAAWGEEALKIAGDNALSLVMLDIRLPDIDGYEVCRRLRTQRKTQDVPIIFLTEKRDRVDKLQGLELGVVDYITKPFDIQELRLRVRNAIARASRQALLNPVTDLPEGPMVMEKLGAVLQSKDKQWAVLLVSISSLSEFRELYGFVTADDMLRAVTLMVRNAVREHGSEDDFIGHIDGEDFLIISTVDAIPGIRERIASRVRQSREYFFPLKDREKVRKGLKGSPLGVTSAVIDHTTAASYKDGEALRDALSNTLAEDVVEEKKEN